MEKDFQSGIGFYLYDGSHTFPLGWGVSSLDDQKSVTDRLIALPENVQFYSYGIDFSNRNLPPHLEGYQWGYQTREGEKKGDWAVRFVPLKEFKEKTYEMVFEGPLADLASRKIDCAFWYFIVPGTMEVATRYVFWFGDPAVKAAEKQAKREKYLKFLINSKTGYLGKVDRPVGVNMGASRDFSIRFHDVDTQAGTFLATAENFFSGDSRISGKISDDGIILAWQEKDSRKELVMTWEGSHLTGIIDGLLNFPVTIFPTYVGAGNGNDSENVQIEQSLAVGEFPGEQFPLTRKRLLTMADVSGWDQEQIQFAINEIYARHGLVFRNQDLNSKFIGKSWYVPKSDLTIEMIDEKLSGVEKANVKLLASMRK